MSQKKATFIFAITSAKWVNFLFWARRDSIEPNSYGNVAGWVAVCHSRYCMKTTKSILKLFRPSDSPIIEAFGTPYADTKFQISNDTTLTRFSRSRHFEVEYLKNGAFYGQSY